MISIQDINNKRLLVCHDHLVEITNDNYDTVVAELQSALHYLGRSPLSLNEYQMKAVSTLDHHCGSVDYLTIALAGEVGELANKVKKITRDHNGQIDDHQLNALEGELGDILWYLSVFANRLGIRLENLAQHNLDKCASRKERGLISGEGDNR